jgi:negative elongation factor B
LKELLNKSFLVVKTKALRPVVMAVMKHLSHVDEKYLKVLVMKYIFYLNSEFNEMINLR